MSVSLVQESTQGTGSGSASASLTGVTSGNLLVLYVLQEGASATKTYTISDNVSGSWTQAAYEDPGSNQKAGLWYSITPGGNVTVTATVSAGTFTVDAVLNEFSVGGATVSLAAHDGLVDSAAATTHTASSAGVSATGLVLALVAGVLNSGGGECTAGTGYTETPAAFSGARMLCQWQAFASGCTNEVGTWTNTTTARTGTSAIALLSLTSSGSTALSGTVPSATWSTAGTFSVGAVALSGTVPSVAWTTAGTFSLASLILSGAIPSAVWSPAGTFSVGAVALTGTAPGLTWATAGRFGGKTHARIRVTSAALAVPGLTGPAWAVARLQSARLATPALTDPGLQESD